MVIAFLNCIFDDESIFFIQMMPALAKMSGTMVLRANEIKNFRVYVRAVSITLGLIFSPFEASRHW
jgi:hypothetical protein